MQLLDMALRRVSRIEELGIHLTFLNILNEHYLTCQIISTCGAMWRFGSIQRGGWEISLTLSRHLGRR